jgi:hypothetical protein
MTLLNSTESEQSWLAGSLTSPPMTCVILWESMPPTTSRFLAATTATSSPQQADSSNLARSVGVFPGRLARHASIGMGGLS